MGKKYEGYGKADAKLAADLRKARSKEEADERARKDGLKDAKDAEDWLNERS